MKAELKRPVNYKDSQLTELDLDLDSLTGNDLIAIESSYKSKHGTEGLWGTTYTAYIAAKSAHLPVEVILNLHITDFFRVINIVWDFFGGAVSKESQPQITAES